MFICGIKSLNKIGTNKKSLFRHDHHILIRYYYLKHIFMGCSRSFRGYPYMSATAIVMMSFFLWWMWICRCWRNYRIRVWSVTTFFHTNWSWSCSHIVWKSTSRMSYNRHPINHFMILFEWKNFFLLILYVVNIDYRRITY